MKVLCTNGVKAVTAELLPAVERTIGLSVDVDYASTNMLMDKIGGGETGDLAVLSAEAIDGLIAKGVLQKGSRVDLARSSIGVAVRRGVVSPDIGSVDALKAALLAAKSVMYSKTGISGVYMPQLLVEARDRGSDRAEGREPVLRHGRRGAGARRSGDRAAADQRIAAGARASRSSARCRPRCNW